MAIIQFVEEKGFLYEVNDKGEQVLVRSTDSSSRAYLRFTNKTSRPVDVWWRDFRGARHHYVSLEPGAHYDVNSYITHPWEFTDRATKERYVVNNSQIYRAPPNLGGMFYRTNWNITVSMRTLKYSAMLTVAEKMVAPCCIEHLGLPMTLEAELAGLIVTLQNDGEEEAGCD